MSLASVYNSIEYESHRLLKKYNRQLKHINQYQNQLRSLSDGDLKLKYHDWQHQIGHFNYQKKKQVQFAMALAREVTYRLLGKFQYDVQVLGGLAALDRNMIQMSTGSGKTITLILPVVVFGLTHRGVNVLTVNDYLSKRDWEETKPVYDWFGLTNAYTSNTQPESEQRQAFESDITYSTNSTLGFAYLNSAFASDIGMDTKIIHRPLFAALIDETDEILMDDARNPLIISGEEDQMKKLTSVKYKDTELSVQWIVNQLKTLSNMGYEEDEHQIYLSEDTLKEVQKKLDLDDSMLKNEMLMHVIYSAVNAIFKYHAYTDYIVQDEPDESTGSQIVLIDKATGRLSPGRTMSDDMHGFIEMKENVYHGQSNNSALQITYQMLFNLFDTIAGFSGTLGTSYKEFMDIYQTGIVVIPDRFENQLKQLTHVYANQKSLYDDLINKTNWYLAAHHPVLIGATSDIGAEIISQQLTQAGIEHKTLVSTDKNESTVVKEAGKPGSVVVTTDIMGRGTDIKVEDVQGERGLVVFQIGSRPNSRVERQFAGRAARQGQPGRYHRMLTVAELKDTGMQKNDTKQFLEFVRNNRALVHHYHDDILLNGRNPEYNDLVHLIDHTLEAKESAESSGRVEDYRAYSMTDIIQVALIAKMDDYRRVLKQSMTKNENEPLYELAAKKSINDHEYTPRQIKKMLPKRIEEVKAIPLGDLQKAFFEYIAGIIDELIPLLREYSENATNTTKLSSQVKYDQKPEDFMMRLLTNFMNQHYDLMVFKLPQLEMSK